MNIPLILCPSWSVEGPHYTIALLKSLLKREGFNACCFDFNSDFFNHMKSDFGQSSWKGDEEGDCWHHQEFVLEIIKNNRSVFNKYVEDILKLNSPVACFSVYAYNLFFSYELAKQIKKKKPETLIIFGGPECNKDFSGLEILNIPHVDAICLGEGEIAFPNFLKIIKDTGLPGFCPGFAYKDEHSKIIDCGEPPLLENLDFLPNADFTDFDFSKYKDPSQKSTRPVDLSILSSKGCIYRCNFCLEVIRMKKYRYRSAEGVFSEIIYQKKKHPEVEYFKFNDSILNGNIHMLDNLCELLIKNNVQVKFWGQASIRKEMNLDFLRKLNAAGFSDLSYGVESGSDKVLKLMNKKFDSVLAEKVIGDTHKAGINATIHIIVGYPGETKKEFKETLDFIKRNFNHIELVILNPFYLMPGTKICNEAKSFNIIPRTGDVQRWTSSNGLNDLQERLRRMNIITTLCREKTFVDTDYEVEYYLERGVRLLDKGDLEKALMNLLLAKKKNKDNKIDMVINSKIVKLKKL